MAVIFEADNFAVNNPKLIETKNGMVFYEKYYNKTNFVPPVPFQLFLFTSPKATLNTNKRMKPKALANRCEIWDEDSIIADEYEPNIFYSIIYNNGTGFNLIKYKETQNKIEFIKSVGLNIYDKYLGQDENYLYYAYTKNRTISGYYRTDTDIIQINKTNLTPNTIATCEHTYEYYKYAIKPNCIRILENKDYIYYGLYTNIGYTNRGDYKGNLSIHRIVKANSLKEDIKINIPVMIDNICNFYDNKAIFKISDGMVGLYFVSLIENEDAKVISPLKLLKLNINETIIDNIVTVEDVNFQWNEDIKEGLSKFPDGTWYSYETFITKIEDKTYVNIFMYQNADQYIAEQIVNQGLYTFELADLNNLKLTDYNAISSSVLKGCLLSNDRKLMIVSTATNTIFMKFDSEEKCYKITNTLEDVPLFIGLDLMERIWIMKQDNEIDMYSSSDTTDFTMKFEKDYYDYAGEDIETYITIEAKNFIGEYISIKVELNIDGNAKFKDTNSKNIQLTTPLGNKLDVPIIITGANQITIYPKIVTESGSH